MLLTIILIFVAIALFLIFRDDHDDSYTKGDRKTGRDSGQKSVYQKSVAPRRTAPAPKPAPVMNPGSSAPRNAPPAGKYDRPKKLDERYKPAPAEPRYASARSAAPRNDARTSNFIYEEDEKVLDFHFLDRIDYDVNLPERTMSSFIAGVQSHCTDKDLGGVVGYVAVDRTTGAMEVHAGDDRLLGFLPMKDRAAFLAFNPTLVVCPFAGHIALSVTGAFYADVRIVLPSTRDFVEESLTGFLG